MNPFLFALLMSAFALVGGTIGWYIIKLAIYMSWMGWVL